MPTVLRLVRFVGFVLLEYIRSGRVLVEMIAAVVFFVVFLRQTGQVIDAEYFFTVTGVFVMALTLYTMSAMLGLGDRPQGYVLLARRLDRTSYLLGYYLGAQVILDGTYGVICAATATVNRPVDLDLMGWVLGTVPLVLNVGLLSALLLMLSPLVFSAGWRLFVLGLIALAFSSNFIGGTLLQSLPEQVTQVLGGVQTVLSWPLVPAFSGFALSLSRDYSGSAFVIIVAQLSLLTAFLGLAVYAFARRDLLFSSQ